MVPKLAKLPMKLLMICLCLASSSIAFSGETESQSPLVGDWADAVDRSGRVRIPLQNPRGHAWFAALRMGTPLEYP